MRTIQSRTFISCVKNSGCTTINILSFHCEDLGRENRHLWTHFILPFTPFACLFLTLLAQRHMGSGISLQGEKWAFPMRTQHIFCSHLKHAWCKTKLDKHPVLWLFPFPVCPLHLQLVIGKVWRWGTKNRGRNPGAQIRVPSQRKREFKLQPSEQFRCTKLKLIVNYLHTIFFGRAKTPSICPESQSVWMALHGKWFWTLQIAFIIAPLWHC